MSDFGEPAMIPCQCPICGATVSVPARRMGQSAKCPACGQQFVLGAEAEEKESTETMEVTPLTPPPIQLNGEFVPWLIGIGLVVAGFLGCAVINSLLGKSGAADARTITLVCLGVGGLAAAYYAFRGLLCAFILGGLLLMVLSAYANDTAWTVCGGMMAVVGAILFTRK